MSLFAILLLGAVTFGTTCAQLLFKAASLRTASDRSGMAYWGQLFAQPALWLGLSFYVLVFFLWLALLSLLPLWRAVMLANIDILAVMIAGQVLFGETLTAARISAVVLIGAGVALVGWNG